MYIVGKNHIDEEGLWSDLLDWTRMNEIRIESKYEKEQKGRSTVRMSTKGGSASSSHLSGPTGKWVAKMPRSEGSTKYSADPEGLAETDKSKCWICRKVDHWSRGCTMKKKLKCVACGAEGHYARDCTARPTVNNVMMVKEVTNSYLKRGRINDVEKTVLLDTGSYYTLLKSSIASRCKIELRSTKKSLYGLGSVSVPSVSAVGKSDAIITVDNVEAGPVKVLIVPDGIQRYNMIIGWMWLDLDSVAYKKEEGKLVLFKTRDDIGLRDISLVTMQNELDILQVLTTLPGYNRRNLKAEDFKYVNTEVSTEDQTKLLS